MENKNLDEIDKKILRTLQKNIRTPFKEIASQCHISTDTIKNRYNKLIQNKVIRGSTIVIDPKKIGYDSITILGLDVEPTTLLHVADEVAKIKEAKNVYISTGDHMIMAEIWARHGKELSEILANKIGKIEGIKRICPAIILEKVKEE